MRTYILRFLYVALFTGLVLNLSAQKINPHSLAIGITSGHSKVPFLRNLELNTSQLGVNLNHQANLSNWFSLRTGLNGSYLFPLYYYERTSAVPDPGSGATTFQTGTRTEQRNFQINLDLMPTLYYRDDGFNLFLGLSGVVGVNVRKSEISGEYYENGQWPVYKDDNERDDFYLQAGWGPTGGVGFNLSGKREGGEIEVLFSYKTFYDETRFSGSNSMSSFIIQTSYRYYFKR